MISVDWSKLAGPAPWYGVAVANARKVGARAGQLLSFLKENVQLNYDDVHVLGFSLGGRLVFQPVFERTVVINFGFM